MRSSNVAGVQGPIAMQVCRYVGGSTARKEWGENKRKKEKSGDGAALALFLSQVEGIGGDVGRVFLF